MPNTARERQGAPGKQAQKARAMPGGSGERNTCLLLKQPACVVDDATWRSVCSSSSYIRCPPLSGLPAYLGGRHSLHLTARPWLVRVVLPDGTQAASRRFVYVPQATFFSFAPDADDRRDARARERRCAPCSRLAATQRPWLHTRGALPPSLLPTRCTH